jgi:gliding motility-associated-like protein
MVDKYNLFSVRRCALKSLFLICLLAASLNNNAQSNCGCWINTAGDTAWHVVPFDGYSPPDYRNDDGSTLPIPLGFNFCFWGTTEDTAFINNNGNISFGTAYSDFTASGFPSSDYKMIAGFWADIDTRNNHSGVVHYKLTPTYLAVQWDTVGYWDTHAGKRNTFQIIISNGSDPIIPYGNNVQFCYQKMEWTTGDFSGGAGGFGGSPAVVGANAGDGVNFVQIGEFDTAGSAYYGQYPSNSSADGVAWLDNKSFLLNTCATHLPPIPSGVSPCDTLVICVGDTVKQLVNFLSIVSTDTIDGGILSPVPTGVTLLADRKGNTDSLSIQFVGSSANQGYTTVTLYGFDNEPTHDTAYTSFVMEVDSNALGNLVISPSSDSICPGDSAKLKIVNTNTHNIQWSNGSTADSIYVKPLVNTTYSCTLIKGKCNPLTFSQTIFVKTIPSLTILHDSVCPGDSDVVNVLNGLSYVWSTGSTQSSIHVKVDTSTTYTCTSSGASCGAQHLSKRAKVVPFPSVSFTGNTVICAKDSTTLNATGGLHYQWSDGTTTTGYTPVKFKPASTTTYTLTAFNTLCSKDTVFTITVNPLPHVTISGSAIICTGKSTTLTATGGGTYLWGNNATSGSITVSPNSITTYKVVVDNLGCIDSSSATVAVDVPLLYVCCNDSLKKGNTVTLTADSSLNYTWNPLAGLSCAACRAPVASPTVTTTYTVTGTDSAGCVTDKTLTVDVYIPCGDFVVPSIFTPNNDGINDDLVINPVGTTSYSIVIFDRWGKQMFASGDPTVYWNGKINNNGTLVPDGVYYYTISASCGSHNYDKKGFVEVTGAK